MKNALLIDQGTGKDGHTGGFWLVCRYRIRGKLATASYSLHPPLFLFPIFLFLDFFFGGVGVTLYTCWVWLLVSCL